MMFIPKVPSYMVFVDMPRDDAQYAAQYQEVLSTVLDAAPAAFEDVYNQEDDYFVIAQTEFVKICFASSGDQLAVFITVVPGQEKVGDFHVKTVAFRVFKELIKKYILYSSKGKIRQIVREVEVSCTAIRPLKSITPTEN